MDMSSMTMEMATSTGSSMPMSTSSSSSMAMDMEQMNMVFFTSTTTLLWTKSFAPETTGQYSGVCIFLIAFASILRMLLALRVNFYSIRDGLRRRRTKGLLVASRASDIENRPWRANEAMMLGAIDVLIAGVSYLLLGHLNPPPAVLSQTSHAPISLPPLLSSHLHHLSRPSQNEQRHFDLVGSTSWIGADAYDPGDELRGRALAVLAKLNWDCLLSVSGALKNGVLCTFSQNFSIGHFNMVRRIGFTDGTSWVARVRLPELRTVFGDREALDVASTLRVEVASMKFFKIRARTSIPVPAVHSYSVDKNNQGGAPYILMDYIHGTVAKELRDANESEIQATLSSFKFHEVGSLYYDEKTSDFFIGPETETEAGKGPWNSALEYYDDLSNHALQKSDKESFSLVNRDFGAHNLLVDDKFQIVGAIDFDSVMAAPIEVVAQYPVLTRLNRGPPACVETRPVAIERIERTKPKLKEYKEMLAALESKLGNNDKGVTPIADLLLSDAASVFQGLVRYQGHQAFVNNQWMEAYLKLIRGRFQTEASAAE
ncbi:hypothetical protein FPRO04_10374 [Fusarium proliferatum]|nr:hypothetical protein FPRO04_10374 [Fusarium proliferatum]